ncbi:Glycosylinositol phosphorylceramide mannosyl transferase 1 [Linum perenne]
MNTWKRYDLLKQSIAHYASCSELDSIHIVWSEPEPPSDSLVTHLNRILQLKSRGIDDDIIFPCSSVEFAFHVWRSAPDTMVGFVPRAHWVEPSDKSKYYTYGGWWSVWWTGTYSMVLSKAAFFHKKYLSLYTNEMPASLKEYTTKNRNCEDIAMSFLVANVTGAPPVWVKGKIFEIGSTGISSLGGHNEKRSQCINRFVAEFGRMPLVSTTVKAVDSRKSWFW